jgi:5'-nucleotidase
MRLLLTNDDGIDAPGLHWLASALVAAGHDLTCVAPLHDMSGSAAGIGHIAPDRHIHTRRAELPGLAEVTAFAVDGPPGLAVLASAWGAFGDVPEAVVSGINAGLNTGHLVLHSGTVGAVLTAQNFGISGLAVSLARGEPWQWETAAAVAVDVLERLVTMPPATALNLNVPACPRDEMLGVRWARLDRVGIVQTASAEVDEGKLQFTFSRERARPEADSDTALVLQGYAAITSLTGVAELSVPDLPGL